MHSIINTLKTYRFNLLLELDRPQLAQQRPHVDRVHRQEQTRPHDHIDGALHLPTPDDEQDAASNDDAPQPQHPKGCVRRQERQQEQPIPQLVVQMLGPPERKALHQRPLRDVEEGAERMGRVRGATGGRPTATVGHPWDKRTERIVRTGNEPGPARVLLTTTTTGGGSAGGAGLRRVATVAVAVSSTGSGRRGTPAVPLVLRYDVLGGRGDRRIFDDQPVRAADSGRRKASARRYRNRMLVMLLRLLDHAQRTRGVHQAQGQRPAQQEHDALQAIQLWPLKHYCGRDGTTTLALLHYYYY